MPKVSVILSSYNHEKFICESIDNTLNQTFADFELIIWDDGSSDNSFELINQYSDPRIKIYCNEENIGGVLGVNKAISEVASGEYIAIHHSDDVWELDKLEKQVAFLDAHADIGAVFTNALPIAEDGSPFADEKHFYSDIFNQPNRTRHEWLRFFFNHGNALCHPSVLIRKEVYEECGLYRNGLTQSADFNMWIRLCMKYEIHVMQEKLVRFRVRDNEANASGSRPDSRIRGVYEFYKILDLYLDIKDKGDFFKTFPSMVRFDRGDDTDIEFVLAMTAFENNTFCTKQLFGIDILFEIIADPVRSKKIEELYGFGLREYVALTGKYDLFSREEVSNLRQELHSKDAHVASLSHQIASLNQAVAEREGLFAKEVSSLRQELHSKDAHVASLSHQIASLKQAVAEREDVSSLRQELHSKDDHIASLNQAVAERDGLIAKVVAESAALKNSTSWKITSPIRWLGRHAHDFKTRITATPGEISAAYVVRIQPPALGYRPKVIHVIANFMTGGSSRLVVDLIENLGDCYDQSVVTSCIPSPPAYIGLQIDEYRAPVDHRPFVDHFSRVKPDFIHVHYWGDCDEPWYAKAVAAAEELGIPVVENINTPIAPFQSPSVRRYVYVSDYVRHVFGRGLDDEITIYPGSDFSHFTRDEPLERAEDCIGMVYRLERDKLSEQAIAPFIHVVRKRPQTRVLIVGGGSLLEPFQKAVEIEGLTGNFEFTGYVPYEDLPDLYRRMAVFVAPVWKESFGQVSPFAMNMYIPVCGYDVGAIGEIIADPSLLAPAGDAERLADIVTRLLNSPEERSAAAANQHAIAQSNFSLQAMIHSYRSLYENMANGGSLK